jgi:hypothetical protein
LPKVPISVTPTNVISVYVNHLYYIVGPSPIEVTADVRGSVTIVEVTQSLAGTQISGVGRVAAAGRREHDGHGLARNAKYTTADSLQGAKIVNRDGTTRTFIPAGSSSDDLQSIANPRARNGARTLPCAFARTQPCAQGHHATECRHADWRRPLFHADPI